jgi:hypothetical protein
MSDVLINKVAESGIVTLDLADYYPKLPIKTFDLKDYLFMGLILKEKDYREALKNTDWNVYNNCVVCINCSADAIIPMWAYMLAASYLHTVTNEIFYGTDQTAISTYMHSKIMEIDASEYIDSRVVVKGCGEVDVPASAYISITHKLKSVVKSIMYGEPCSTVPIYKKMIAK